MNEQILDNESLLEDETLTEDNISSDESNEIEDKLDRIEALLNEDIALREQEEEVAAPVLETRSGASTSSGVDTPNYNQYIYDLLTDSTIKVEIVEQEDITTKPLNSYSIEQSEMAILIVVAMLITIAFFIERHVFKRR